MKRLTKILFVAGGSLLLTGGAVANYLAAQPETLQEELTLANLEAMSMNPDDMDLNPGDPDWGMVSKRCYMAFTNDYDGDYYATCSQISSNPQIMFPCGAISAKKPAWGVTMVYYCYEPAYEK